MKSKTKVALNDEQKADLYAKSKVKIEDAFGNIKGNLSFTRFLFGRLEKVQTGFRIVAIPPSEISRHLTRSFGTSPI
ncbi:hypothetical protein [Anoxybacillus sp. P3H1B]|uniref:hypothetical protein n=1 Tax=Anoxybacillus sp. P3H1B TaxID=1769293 RepID=UPI003515C117